MIPAEILERPFWHEAAPLDAGAASLPAQVDVVVIGAGFTGLSCAKRVAEAGRSVVVLDAAEIGFGASTRNGGMVGWGHRGRFAPLAKRYGPEGAMEILAEGKRSLDFTTALIAEEGIDCDFVRSGRYLGAASEKHFNELVAEAEMISKSLRITTHVLSKADQAQEIVTDAYFGGLLFEEHGAVHPGKMHRGLLAAARRAGAVVIGKTPATKIDIDPAAPEKGAVVATPSGAIKARDVVFAANGYVGAEAGALAAFQRRLIPIPSFIIATEPLGRNRVASLMPGGRSYVDTRSVHSYFRPDPTGDRILWGGRASLTPIKQSLATRRLRGHMSSIFPDLRDVALTHSWTGNIAYTRDGIPHIGRLGGVWYAGGYCGSGVAMAPYLGWKLAERITGGPDGAVGLDAAPFLRVPPYRGTPWFMRAVEAWHKVLDWRDGVKPPR